ncbi:MAG: hypothetical protein JXA96_07020 [Sedimentisphaerales bacterium]|nr:hypothetical protein [Sedimentisphaerales bacterium]
MRIHKCYIYISFCIIFYCSSLIFAEEQNSQIRSGNTSIQEPKTNATFELVDKWKATLFSCPIIHKVPGINGEKVTIKNLLYYVEFSYADSKEIRYIWQCELPESENSPDSTPRNFTFGTTDNNNFSLAFFIGFNIYFFELNPNNEISLYQENDKVAEDIKSPTMRIIEHDPNNVISLSKIFTKEIVGSFIGRSISIDSVFSNENYAVFNLTIKDQRFILRYSVVDGEPVYSVYKTNEVTK